MAYENVPYELKEMNNWICWKLENDAHGRPTKKPYDPRSGQHAKSNDSSTWTDFETVLSHVHDFSGIGFMLSDDVVGIDIDNVPSEIEKYLADEDADNIVSEFIDTLESYAEISPSGNGIHILIRGTLPEGGRRRGNVEMYSDRRFLTVTGQKIGSYNHLNDDSDYNKLGFLHHKYIQNFKKDTPKNTTQSAGNNVPIDELIQYIKNSKNNIKFDVLYNLDWSQLYDSQSEADMALANILAFWTARDYNKMDKMFRQSKLYRDKWDEKRGDKTYGEITLTRAIEDCKSEFRPQLDNADGFQIKLLDDAVQKVQKKKYYSYDDTGNAQRLRDKYGDFIRYNYTAKKWMYYDKTRWVYDSVGKMKILTDRIIEEMKNDPINTKDYSAFEEKEIKKFLTRHLKDSRNHNKKENMLKEAQHLLPVHHDVFDKDFHLFNTQNGYIDLNTGLLHEHDKDVMFTKISNTEYTDNADAPQWESFLNDIFLGNKELIKFIQRAVGYSLSGHTTEQVMFVLFGNGRNGKSVFIDIINEILGSYSTNIRPQAIMTNSFGSGSGPTPEIAKLDGARFVTTTEPNEGDRFDEGLLKQLTGGDRVSARKLHENEFEFTPQLKIWMATNHKPYVRGTDDGIWRRFVIIPFEKKIPLHEVDIELPNKLKKELPAILKWCVDGYAEWKRIGLAEPKIVSEQREEYRNEMDPVEMFIDECCKVISHGRVGSSTLFQAYDKWASENRQYRMNHTKFGKEMKKHFKSKKTSGVIKYEGLELLDAHNPNFITLRG